MRRAHAGALRCIPRSLVSAPAVHHSMSRWRRPAAGWGAAPNCCVAERRSENLGACQLWKENHRGVKIIRAQHYAGVDKKPGVHAAMKSGERQDRSSTSHCSGRSRLSRSARSMASHWNSSALIQIALAYNIRSRHEASQDTARGVVTG